RSDHVRQSGYFLPGGGERGVGQKRQRYSVERDAHDWVHGCVWGDLEDQCDRNHSGSGAAYADAELQVSRRHTGCGDAELCGYVFVDESERRNGAFEWTSAVLVVCESEHVGDQHAVQCEPEPYGYGGSSIVANQPGDESLRRESRLGAKLNLERGGAEAVAGA